jgi:hypothetical protein
MRVTIKHEHSRPGYTTDRSFPSYYGYDEKFVVGQADEAQESIYLALRVGSESTGVRVERNAAVQIIGTIMQRLGLIGIALAPPPDEVTVEATEA